MNPLTPAASLRTYYESLLAAYGPQSWWPSETRFETIVGAILTQGTSWTGVVKSIAQLRQANALSIVGIRAVTLDSLRTLIRPSGYMVRKAASLKAFVEFLDSRHAGSLDQLAAQPTAIARTQLLSLLGIGPETADAILLYALGHPVIVVDEYLRRVVTRHALTPAKVTYAALQQLADPMLDAYPPESRAQHANEFHALIVEVGKRHCRPKPICSGCPLECFLPRP